MEFPMRYETNYEWSGESDTGEVRLPAKADLLKVAGPFRSNGFDPESLFVAAAEICLANTLFFFANRARLKLDSYQSSARGELEQAPEGGFRFREIVIRPVIGVDEGDREKMAGLLEKAHRYCLISRSMRCRVRVEHEMVPVG